MTELGLENHAHVVLGFTRPLLVLRRERGPDQVPIGKTAQLISVEIDPDVQRSQKIPKAVWVPHCDVHKLREPDRHLVD